MPAQRNPESMRNLPLIAFRLTHARRTPCQVVADALGVSLNELARQALLEKVERVNADGMRVNTGAPPATGARAITVVRDEG